MVQNKVLIIHCGGTLGMVQTVNGYGVKRDNLFKLIYNNEKLNNNCVNKTSVELENCMNEEKEIDCFGTDLLKKVKRTNDSYAFYDYNFTLVHDKITICYNLIELNDIIDSSLARLDDWHVILQIVNRFANDYDGFVIVHGTDTLSYASAFFYYMTSGVKIICTGAIAPMVVDKQEGENNIVNCLVNVNTVKCASVCFGNYIMAGNDVHKIETDSKNAFWSSKMKHLGGDVGCGQMNSIAKCTDCTKMSCTVGNRNEIAKEDQIVEQTIHTKFSDKIGLIKIYPGISSRIFEAFFTSYDAIIIETFGCGNGLTNNNDILDLIQKYTKLKVIVNVSQCLNGCINEMYEVNSKLARCGVISGGGLKTEAVFCLLAWALGNFNIENAKKMIIDQIKKE